MPFLQDLYAATRTTVQLGVLHGTQVLAAGDHLVLPPLKVFRLPGATRVRRPEARGGERSLIARDLQRVHGVLVTTPLRTALDLSPAARAEIGARARAHVLARYTTRAMQDATLDVYRELA